MDKSSKTRLGLFIFLSVLVFFVGILSLGERKGWFQTTFTTTAQFFDINGLENGAPVRISGINAGTVTNIIPPRELGTKVTVVMEIDDTYRELVRLDALAHIETEGLVGYKLVIIEPGTQNTDLAGDQDAIQSIEPVKISDITDRFYNASNSIQNIVESVESIADSIQGGRGTIGRLIYDPSLYNNITSASVSVDSAFTAFTKESKNLTLVLSQLSTSMNSIVDKIDRGEGTIGQLVSSDSLYDDLKSSSAMFFKVLTQLEEGVYSFAENMEALKHNWFFKGYYEERGYWNREEFVRIDEYLNKRQLELQKLQEDLQTQLKRLEERERQVREAESRLQETE